MKPQPPSVPFPLPMARALDQSSALGSLTLRLAQSQQRLQVAQSVVAPGLAPHFKAGPLDDTAWVILVPNAAVAAKLRQWLPHIRDALLHHGHADLAIKIHIQA